MNPTHLQLEQKESITTTSFARMFPLHLKKNHVRMCHTCNTPVYVMAQSHWIHGFIDISQRQVGYCTNLLLNLQITFPSFFVPVLVFG